jgi:ATP-dependent DNA helicase RecQ
MVTFEHNKLPEFGSGKERGEIVWKSVLRQAVLNNFLIKDIDSYGILKLSKYGKSYIDAPYSIKFVLNRDFDAVQASDSDDIKAGGGALDDVLLGMFKDLRKKIAKQKSIPPFVIFQDPSLEEMASQYPISIDELKQISGVGHGKAMRFGAPFIEMIKKYVDENDIDRPQDMVVKSTVNKSSLKVSIIQNIDRQIPLNDIASSKGLDMSLLIQEIESIVSSGTKLNINYYIDDVLDEDRQDEIFDYFRSSEEDSLELALAELGEDDYTREEIQLMRIKFISELGN